jgi:hypothetical protein
MKRILLSIPHMGGAEQAYVQQAFDSNWLSTVGPNLTAFEQALENRVGLPAVALTSGTAAIHLGLRLLGVGSGDEVFCPTLTFAASCNPVRYLGAEPVFLDDGSGMPDPYRGFHGSPADAQLLMTLSLKEVEEFLNGQACVADQRPEGPLREFLVVGHGETPVGRFGVTKDHVASFLHVDFITEAAQGFRGLRSGDDGQFHQPAT